METILSFLGILNFAESQGYLEMHIYTMKSRFLFWFKDKK